AQKASLLSDAPRGKETQRFVDEAIKAQLGKQFGAFTMQLFFALRDPLNQLFKDHIFFWPRKTGPKGDLVDDEMGRVLQVPGWSNIFTQPIINRIEMLSTGVRTDIGVKVFGPNLDTIDKVCKEVEGILKPIPGAR